MALTSEEANPQRRWPLRSAPNNCRQTRSCRWDKCDEEGSRPTCEGAGLESVCRARSGGRAPDCNMTNRLLHQPPCLLLPLCIGLQAPGRRNCSNEAQERSFYRSCVRVLDA